uniref:Uncharacterized protein n=1 Tax=Arundo donax TaxID=35708 RepID=A0A0A9GVR9_ARUDO
MYVQNFVHNVPWDLLDSKAIILDTDLHEGVGNPLPEILEDLGERLADALGRGGHFITGKVVVVPRRVLRFLRPPRRAGLRSKGVAAAFAAKGRAR